MMSTHLISADIAIATLSVATAGFMGSEPDDAHMLGDHPAVIINKTGVSPSYMSAMTTYPHPAWFWRRGVASVLWTEKGLWLSGLNCD
jgi:hypothetical protein